MSAFHEATGESAPLPLRYKFIKGAGDRKHEEALSRAAKEGYKPILMALGNSHEIVVLAENKAHA